MTKIQGIYINFYSSITQRQNKQKNCMIKQIQSFKEAVATQQWKETWIDL